ncbi:hypothetical protein ACEYW6_18545 [Nostoc sp. UIC 10607]
MQLNWPILQIQPRTMASIEQLGDGLTKILLKLNYSGSRLREVHP